MSERWLQDPVDSEDSVWKSDFAILDPRMSLADAANTSQDERIADRAVLDAIVRARRHENPERQIAAILQISQNAFWDVFTEGKHDKLGKHRLTGPYMTIYQLLERFPIERWPRAGGNGCYNVHCNHNDILRKDYPGKDHKMVFEQRMVDGEGALVSGLAHLLNARVYS
jgi:hypothetical protein